jgi:hypothetical protein
MMELLAAAVGALVATAAVVTAVGIIAKSEYLGRPIRWLWRRNVSDPAGGWFRHLVAEVVDDRIDHLMHHNNSGSSLLDLAESVAEAKQQIQATKADVALLLEHDAERDMAGRRYGPDQKEDHDE